MAGILYWEDVQEGSEIPPLTKRPTIIQLVRYTGAERDFTRIHYDQDYARRHGFPSVILHGRLKYAFMGQLLTDWIGSGGRIKKMACQYRHIDLPGDTLTCKGRVTRRYVEDGVHYVQCDVWVENGKGEITTPGSATVVLPSREPVKG